MTSDVPEVVEVSVVIPTIGRPQLLEACLGSLCAARPRAAEVVVVDQSADDRVAAVVAAHAECCSARRVPDVGRGPARAVNRGLRSALHPTVLKTDDDCTVDRAWVGEGARLFKERRADLVTGRTRAVGLPGATPSTREDTQPRFYSGESTYGALVGNNLVLPRDAVLAIGGFDETFDFAAEDADFCFRWLRAGRTIAYEPSLVVWHHGWRSRNELEALYRAYWRGAAQFYVKHLRAAEWDVVPLLARDLVGALRSAVLRNPAWSDPSRGLLRGFVPGVVAAVRTRRSAPQ